GAVLLLASALSLTWSRGVALALLPALGALVLLRFGVSRGVKAFLFAGLPLLAVAGWHSASRFFAADVYNYGRWVFWRVALRIFPEHPFGVGLGGYKYFWFQAQEPFPEAFRHYAKYAQSPHNEYLEVLVGLGFLGLLFFLLAIVPPMAAAARGWKEVPEDRRGIAAGAFSALVLTGTQALFNFNFHEAGIFCTDALLLGALLACLPEGSLGRPLPLPAWLAKTGALACLLLAASSLSLLAGTAAFERGMSSVRGGETASAERYLKAASMFDPLRSAIPDALSGISFRRYRLAAREGDAEAPRHLEESIRLLRRARDLCPMEPAYPQRMAMLYWEGYRRTGSPAALGASLSSFDETLRVNPYRVEALWEKAFVLREVGRRDEADAALLRAVSIEPNFCRAYAKLAESSKGKGEPESLAWEARAAQCRQAAEGRALEENERWLVEETGTATGAE
ncbi:MAG: O-antigen ligase family protein, partial [Deltaproteobacteria bacterium]|nr:O-antigen ligase family protein [Deltaproteobacteria bacterium]